MKYLVFVNWAYKWVYKYVCYLTHSKAPGMKVFKNESVGWTPGQIMRLPCALRFPPPDRDLKAKGCVHNGKTGRSAGAHGSSLAPGSSRGLIWLWFQIKSLQHEGHQRFVGTRNRCWHLIASLETGNLGAIYGGYREHTRVRCLFFKTSVHGENRHFCSLI